ncbi:hypothetical protein [Moraxella bovis]|uniref:Uncharacterized protein n=1 Tax=Moraxella bovis TaxID=476 RepID=A0ABY6M610_MORBO|nr:hypothetical protein [Moraxella bovis]UZA02947.1 hypothetical protein LP092_13580 [Moraxella bovis]UZA19158.1 hypothetical protein LP088_12820 [Moraxella bovis]UZA54040.1 hypothetical protein LP111_12795 [Moraxella bovis]UZA57354.1 hypothetical protein LP127_01380 [Moraxella bovis]
MIILQRKAEKIAYFVHGVNPNPRHEYSQFMSLYLHKALTCLNDIDEVTEYCTKEFANIIGNYKTIDKRVYPLESLQRDKFLSLVFYYKGLQAL